MNGGQLGPNDFSALVTGHCSLFSHSKQGWRCAGENLFYLVETHQQLLRQVELPGGQRSTLSPQRVTQTVVLRNVSMGQSSNEFLVCLSLGYPKCTRGPALQLSICMDKLHWDETCAVGNSRSQHQSFKEFHEQYHQGNWSILI